MYFTHTSHRLIVKLKDNEETKDINLTTASSVVIRYHGPDGIIGEWTAFAEPGGRAAIFQMNTSSLTEPGLYELQLVAVINGDTIRFDKVQERFAAAL